MHLVFDQNLDYQQLAAKSVVGLFEGQPFTDELIAVGVGNMQSLFGTFGNTLLISQGQILKNLHGKMVYAGTAIGGLNDEMLKFQICKTLGNMLKKRNALKIEVYFFISFGIT